MVYCFAPTRFPVHFFVFLIYIRITFLFREGRERENVGFFILRERLFSKRTFRGNKNCRFYKAGRGKCIAEYKMREKNIRVPVSIANIFRNLSCVRKIMYNTENLLIVIYTHFRAECRYVKYLSQYYLLTLINTAVHKRIYVTCERK